MSTTFIKSKEFGEKEKEKQKIEKHGKIFFYFLFFFFYDLIVFSRSHVLTRR